MKGGEILEETMGYTKFIESENILWQKVYNMLKCLMGSSFSKISELWDILEQMDVSFMILQKRKCCTK